MAFDAAGITGKIVKFDVAGADAEIRFGHRACDVDWRAVFCCRPCGRSLSGSESTQRTRCIDALRPRAGASPPRCGARCEPSAKTTVISSSRQPAAEQFIQNGGQDLIARHGTGNVACHDGGLLARTLRQLTQTRRADRMRERVTDGVFAAAFMLHRVGLEDAHEVLVRARLRSARRSRIQIPVSSARPQKRFRRVPKRLDHGEFFPGEEADERAAAGADIAELVLDLIFGCCCYAVAAANDGIARGSAERLEDGLCAELSLCLLEDRPSGR